MKINGLWKAVRRGAVIVLAAVCVAGCATAYKATAVSTKTVSAAIGAWSDYVDQGKATIEDRKAVLAAVVKYRAALATAQTAVNQWFAEQESGKPFPQAALNTLGASTSDLIVLIETLKSKKGAQ